MPVIRLLNWRWDCFAVVYEFTFHKVNAIVFFNWYVEEPVTFGVVKCNAGPCPGCS